MRLGLLLLISTLYCASAWSQTVVVTDDGTYTTGNTSSVLDVKSISKGFLMPRLTLAQRTAISTPATGLMVYQTDGTPGFYHYDGATWKVLSTTTNTIGVTNGGTGLTAATLGDLHYGSASNTISNLAGNITASKRFLTQTGTGTVSAAPGWNAIVAADIPDISATYSPRAGSTALVTLGTVATGTWNATAIGVNKGGTGLTTAALGDLRYASAANTIANLAGNITTTKKFLTQTGTGTVSAAPGWNTLSVTDIPDISATYSPIAGSASIATVGTINTGTWNATTIATTKGGTGLTAYTTGDMPYASAANTLSNLSGNTSATKKFLTQTGNGTTSAAPVWNVLSSTDISDLSTNFSPIAGSTGITTLGTVTAGTWNATAIAVPQGGTGITSYATGDIPYASAANTLSSLPGNTTTTRKYLNQTGTGSASDAPQWDPIVVADISDIATTYAPIGGSTSITTVGTIATGIWNATTIGVTKGGTGLTTVGLGEISYGSAANVMANLPGNTTATKRFLTQTGTGSASAAPGWNAIVAADIPDISATYSPRAGSTALTTVGTITTGTWSATDVSVAAGGTGNSSATAYALQAGGTTSTGAHQSLATGTAGQLLKSGGPTALPTWNTLTGTDVGLGNVENTALSTWAGSSNITTLGNIATGTWNATTIGVTKGGTGLTTVGLGEISYGSAANVMSNLAGNTTTAKRFLTQTGTGTVSAAPGWNAIIAADIPDISATYSPRIGSTSFTTAGTIATGTWNATTIATNKGGTGLTSYTTGDIPYASAANTLSNLAGNTTTTRRYLSQTGNGTISAAPAWDDLTTADISDIATTYSPIAGSASITTVGTVATGTWNATTIGVTKGGTGLTTVGLGEISYGSAANVMSNLPGNTTTTKKFLTQTGNGSTSAAPGWNTLSAADMPTGIDVTDLGSGIVTTPEFEYLSNVTSDIQTQINNKENAWTTYKVAGTDATTTGTTLVNVAGLVTGTLLTSTSYEYEAVLNCLTTAVTTGTKYGVNLTVTPTIILAQYSGAVTATTGGITTTNANNTASATTFLTTSAQSGIVIIKGIFTTASTGSPVFSIRHLKVTSGTSTVRIGSILRVRAL